MKKNILEGGGRKIAKAHLFTRKEAARSRTITH